MSNAELIAEAEMRADDMDENEMPQTAACFRKLAAALRERDVPAGWRVTEYAREDGATVVQYDGTHWEISLVEKDDPIEEAHYPTAAAAMAALEESGR